MNLPYHLGIHQTLNISMQPKRGTAAWYEKNPQPAESKHQDESQRKPKCMTNQARATYISLKRKNPKLQNPTIKNLKLSTRKNATKPTEYRIYI
jgi:hypothetical protein